MLNINFRNGGSRIEITAENVLIEETAYDFNETNTRDIKDEILDVFVNTTEDLIINRTAPYDSSRLIENLFEKLPLDDAEELLTLLQKNFKNK